MVILVFINIIVLGIIIIIIIIIIAIIDLITFLSTYLLANPHLSQIISGIRLSQGKEILPVQLYQGVLLLLLLIIVLQYKIGWLCV